MDDCLFKRARVFGAELSVREQQVMGSLVDKDFEALDMMFQFLGPVWMKRVAKSVITL